VGPQKSVSWECQIIVRIGVLEEKSLKTLPENRERHLCPRPRPRPHSSLALLISLSITVKHLIFRVRLFSANFASSINRKIKYPRKFGFTVAHCLCFHCNLAAEYSTVVLAILVLAVVNWSLSCYCLTRTLVLVRRYCTILFIWLKSLGTLPCKVHPEKTPN